MRKSNLYILLGFALSFIMVSCSTTKRIEEDELLYTGVKKIKIETRDTVEIPDALEEQLTDLLSVSPNNPLYSPYVRTPFPVGLWVYNNWTITPKSSGIKKWLYNTLVSEPVLVSTVRPEMRMEMLQDILNNNGYFGSTTKFEVLKSGKNPKKARISYYIETSVPYTISSVEYLDRDDDITRLINNLAKKSHYLKSGSRYCTDSLSAVRTKISNILRNRGYYYFRPEFIEYQADSVMSQGQIALRMAYSQSIPEKALKRYYTGDITTTVNRIQGGGTPDTMYTNRGMVIQMKPSRLRKSLIPSCVTFKKGKVLMVRDFNKTQGYLSRVGMFKSINIDVPPIDSISEDQDSIDVNINCTFDAPIEARFEVNTSYKSNSYLGPGLGVGISHNNLFGGGEKLSFDLTGSYEWQIGKASGSSKDNNYYELGFTTSLTFPRLLAPNFIKSIKREMNWTKISLSANFYNNPTSIKFLQLSAELMYQWHTNRFVTHELSFPKLTYSKRLREPELNTEEDQNMWEDMTKRSEFIPQFAYTFNLDKSFGDGRKNRIALRASIAEAGNLLSGIWGLAEAGSGVGGKELFGVPFSQYVKLETQLVYSRKFFRNHHWVSRILVGAGFVYGNSAYMPYGEDFYAGGPNTIRSFGIKSLGPGSFKDLDGYDSQFLHSGSFQFILNTEYRFPILGMFHGAVFVDAGNVWLFKDPLNAYPGGVIKGKNFFKEMALGTGFGFRLDMDMLVVRADLGIGIHAPYDTGKSGYYNMTSFKNSLAFNIAIGYPF